MADLEAVDALLDVDLQRKSAALRDSPRTEARGRSQDREQEVEERRKSGSPRRRSPSPRHRSRSPRRSPSRRHRSRSPRRRRSRSPRRPRSPRYRRERSPPYYRRRRRTPPPSRRGRSPPPPVSSADRDARTVTCLQLHRKCTAKDLAEFLQEKVGPLVSCRVVTDRNTGRSKGIAYAEFKVQEDAVKAIGITGQPLMGAPIVIKPTEAEKNRIAAEKARQEQLAKTKILVENLPDTIGDDTALRKMFESFGRVRECGLSKDQFGRLLGTGFVMFDHPKDATEAVNGMNGHAIRDKVLHVTYAVEAQATPGTDAALPLDRDELEKTGVQMTQASRADLMQKLAAGRPGGTLPMTPGAPSAGISATPTSCLKLSNMFDPTQETDPQWHMDVRDEVLEASMQHGPVFHIFVDKTSPQGQVFLKFQDSLAAAQAYAAMNGRLFDGRQVRAEYLKEILYTTRFPEAAVATTPLTVASQDE